jgi:hypothetical protein
MCVEGPGLHKIFKKRGPSHMSKSHDTGACTQSSRIDFELCRSHWLQQARSRPKMCMMWMPTHALTHSLSLTHALTLVWELTSWP